VVKSFGGSARRVLDGVSLDIASGRVNFVIGRSGEGKSVLLKLLTGLQKPDSGRVFYDELDLVKASGRELAALRRRMGLLFQDGALFDSMSVGENVVFPLWFHGLASSAEAARRGESLLEELGLAGAFKRRVSELSVGERKRAALARALIMEPEVVFFDEPTTGLDPLLSEQVDDLIVHAQKRTGATVVVVSHDMAATLSLAHMVTLLRAGRVVLSGPPEQFRTSDDPEVRRFLTGEAEDDGFFSDFQPGRSRLRDRLKRRKTAQGFN
jgi:phospholipid/cholesterol/gamma-HCH transport system ATP-binding protein